MTLSLFLAFLLALGASSGLAVSDSPQPRVLLVRDAHTARDFTPENPNEVYGKYYDQALNSNDLNYTNYTVGDSPDNGPSYDTMKKYDIVIWFTGDDYTRTFDYPTLTSTDVGQLHKYLENGGKLFFTGQDIGHDAAYYWGTQEQSFYEGNLSASFIKGDSEIEEEENDLEYHADETPISYQRMINISGGAGNQEYPSVIGNLSSAEKVFVYNEKKLCYKPVGGDNWKYDVKCGGKSWKEVADHPAGGIRLDTGGPSGYKVVYFAFGFEGIKSKENREVLMERITEYLRGPKTKNTKVYQRNLGNTSYIDLDTTCDPDDDYCLREMDPKINATCENYQLFANVSGGEYIFAGQGENMTPVSGGFDGDTETVEESIDPTVIYDTIYNSISERLLIFPGFFSEVGLDWEAPASSAKIQGS